MGAEVKAQTKLITESEKFVQSLVKSAKTMYRKRKHFDPANVGLLSEDGIVQADVTEWIPSMFPQLDAILGGGWPVRRAIEVFGPEGVGKSALTHMAVKGCQSVGGIPIVLDFERALDMEKMIQLDIDPDRVIYCTPDTIEQGWDTIWHWMGKLEETPPPAPALFVWDSIAGSLPEAELNEKASGDSHVGLIARAMSKGCRKMYRAISKVRATMLWVNQIREIIGAAGFGKKTESVGGRAVRFASTIRINLAYKKQIKVGKRVIGYQSFPRTHKNKIFPPHRETSFIIDFEYGPSPQLSMLDFLIKAKKVKASGTGGFVGTWSKKKFDKREGWFNALTNPSFREGAEKTFKDVLEKLATTDDDDDDE
jgi:recombination protein RecA